MKSDDIFHALWIGKTLPAMAAGCLASFVRQGHSVHLYLYDALPRVPEGVELRDANKIVPRERIFLHHKNKSLSSFSDHFCYTLLHRLGGTWIDCDLYCLRPIPAEEEILLGYQSPDVINKSLLRLPKGSKITKDLLGIFEHRQSYLPWLQPATRRRAWLRHHFLRKPYYEVIPFATTGPVAVSWFLREAGLEGAAKPRDVFYPLSFDDAGRAAEADFSERDCITERSLTIHLWNEVLRLRKGPPEPGSLVARIEAEGEGGPPAVVVA